MIQKKYRTKREMIMASLKEEILTGKLKGKTRLLISEVAARYEVSEIPVREAFQVLIQEDLIRPSGAGFEVSALSPRDVKEIFQIRISLECLAAELAVENISNKQIEELAEMITQASALIEQEDMTGYWRANRKFHMAIYAISENERLIQMIQSLYDCTFRYPTWYTRIEELVNSEKEHKAILEAYRLRDTKLAVDLIRRHTVDSYHHVLKRIEEQDCLEDPAEQAGGRVQR